MGVVRREGTFPPETSHMLLFAKKSPRRQADAPSPFTDGKRQFAAIFSDHVLERDRWRLTAIICASAAVLSIAFGLFEAQAPKFIPYPIMVNKDGTTQQAKTFADDPTLRNIVVKRQIIRYVTAIFTRTGSLTADAANLRDDVGPLSPPTSAAMSTVNTYLTDPQNNPQTASTLAQVSVADPDQRSADSYYVRWQVTTRKPDGSNPIQKTYDVTLTVQYQQPGPTEDQLIANPTGLAIMTFPFQQIP